MQLPERFFSPEIAILMPIYNAATTVVACLEGMISQTFGNFELIAVDDGSTDATATIIKEFARKDSRIKLIRQQKSGIVAALNLGLSHCQAKYIARMDADDLMHPERLDLQLRFLKEHPQYNMIGTLYRNHIQPNSKTTAAMSLYQDWSNSLLSHAAIKEEMFVELPILHPTFFAEKSFFEQLKGYRDYPWPEDYDFFLRAAALGAIFGKVEQTLLYRGDRPERLTRIDARYKRPAMFQAKAHFLAKGTWLEKKRGIVIAGTGPSGKQVAKALARENLPIDCFVDNIPSSSGRTVMGIPAFGFVDEISASFLEQKREFLFLVCIGEQSGKKLVRRQMEKNGFVCGKDFIHFI